MDKNPENNRLDSNLELPSTLVSTDVEASPEPSRARFQLLRFNRTAFSLVVITIMILLLLGGGGILLSKKANSSGSQILPAKITNFAVSDPSLQGLNGVGSLQLGKSQSLSINGELHVNSGLIIQPTDQPLTGQAGQLYFDKTTKQPYYYNGTGFVSLASATAPLVKTPAGVRSLGGLTGAIELGNGLQVLNGKLQLSSDLLQPTTAVSVSSNLVSSVQGQTGAINFGAGSGISVNGTTITNTGLLSLGGAIGDLNIGRGLSIQAGALKSTVSLATSSSNLVITEDGNGNYSINDTAFAAGSQVTLAPLVAQLDASNRSVIRVDKTNTTGNFLQFSSSGIDKFVVTQSGAIAVGSIDYSQITNTPAPGVTSIGSTTGVIGLGTGLSLAGNTLSNTGVTSLSGTPNQVIVSASTGNIVVSLPQDLAVGSSPIFIGLGLSGNLNVGGTSTIGGDQSVGGNSAISGSSTITNGLTVSGTTSLAGNLDIGGNSAFNGNVSLAGSKTFTTGSGTISLGGPLTVSSNSNLLGSLNVASTTTLSSTLAVSGNTTLSGTLNVIGANTFTGLGTFDGGITIANNGNFSQAGTGSFSTGTGPTSIGGTLGVNGLTTLNGAVSVANSFSVSNGTGLVGNFSGRVSGGNAVANNEFVTLGQVSSLGAGNYIANGTTPQTADFNVTGSGTVSNITVTSGAAIGGTLTVASGITISSFGVGIVQSNASGVLSSGAVSRNDTNYFNATLTVGNGGTGATILAANGLLYGNGTGVVQATVAAANSILATNGTNTPGLTQTLPTAVQGNITSTGALAAGSIATGFGSISTANIIATTGTLQGGSVNSTSGFQLNGTNINTAGTLSNVAYLNQANVFSAAQTINGTLAVNAGTGIVGTFSGRVSGANAVSSNEFTTLGQITALGAGSYIANGTASQSNANFNIQALTSGTAGTIGGIIRGAAGGQTADLLQFQNSAGTVLASVSAAGSVTAPNFTGKFLGTATSTASDLQFATQINGSNPARIYADGTAIFSTVSANNFTSDTGTLSQQVITGKVNGNVNTYVQADGGAQFRYVGIGAAPGQTTNLIVSTLATNNIGFVLQGHSGQTGDLQQFLNSSGTVLSRFDASGNLGIGTVGAPAYKLDVQGGTGIVGQFSGRVIGANAVNNNEFATFGQIAGAIGGASANYIANNTSLQTSANFNISGTGTANVLQATGLDAASASILTVGGSNATSITLAQNTVIAAGKSLTVTGSTAFPTSPSEGQIYYRTDTKQLYVYANGKWQADRSSATLIVAANNSQNKEKADYVGDGTNDQNAINAAIAALPTTGGSVVLLDGTFNIKSDITLNKANVLISGQGTGTKLVRQYNAAPTGDTGIFFVTVDNITITNLQIDGNKAVYTTSNNNGIGYLSATSNASTIDKVSIINCAGSAIFSGNYVNYAKIVNSSISSNANGIDLRNDGESVISNNVVTNNTGIGINAGNNRSATITTNLVKANGSGIQANTGSVVTGNVVNNNINDGIQASGTGASVSGNSLSSNGRNGIVTGNNTTVTGNQITGSGSYGISAYYANNYRSLISDNNISNSGLDGMSIGADGAIISNNYIANSGGNGGSSGITLGTGGGVANGAKIFGNTITDTSGTGYAISINSASTGVSLGNNVFSGTGASSINDLGKATIYANQLDASGNQINRNQGGLSVGTMTATNSLTLQGSFQASQLPTPSAPTVTAVGTAGTTTYTYAISALDGSGETLPSSGTVISTANATLTGTNYNTISWTQVGGAVQYKVYRIASGGTPATTGLIGTVTSNVFTFSDTGLAASSAAAASNSTGNLTIAGTIQGGGALSISGNSSLGGPLTVGLPATTGGVTVSTAGNLSVRNNNNAASVLNAVDSTGATSLEVRAGLATDMNLFVGLGAGAINTTGTGKNNVGISQYALGANTTGVQNVAIGTFALGNNVSGSNNIGIGFSSQTVNTTGGDNIALGSSSLKTNSVGSNNIAIGSLALSLATASNNTAIGTYALQNTTTGSGNTAVGASAGYNGNGSNNAILGFNSGSGAGSNNVFVGYNTGVNAGSNNIFLGNNAGAGDTGSNKLYIGSLLTGDFAANLLTLNGNLTVSGVGTSTFAGSVGISGTLTANSAFVTTSLRIGDATNNASFDATTKQLRFSGTARNDRTVSLKPQFEGGTLSADGTANAGTITSAYCSNVAGGLQVNFGAGKACANANDSHSYYEWTTTAATAQNYDVFVRYRVPSDFDNTGDFGTNASIGVYGWRTNTANDAVTTTIYNQAGQACNGDQANIGAAATWSKLDLALTGTNCDINANEYITMKIHLVAGTNDFARVGEVEINYKSVF
jgi:fibronectin-binding autotransporter adhesin